MRILFISSIFPNPWQAGKGPFTLALCKALQHKHEVRVISPIAWTDEWSARRHGAAKIDRRAVIDGIRVQYPRCWYPPMILRMMHTTFYRRSIAAPVQSLTSNWHPDVVVSFFAHPDGEAANYVARELDVPSVVIVGGADILQLTRDPQRRQSIINTLQSANAVVAVSRQLKDKTVDLGVPAGRVHVWAQGVDETIFHPGNQREARVLLNLKGDDPIMLWVGRMVPDKGLDLLIDVCASLAKRAGLRFRLWLVGEGPLKQKLRYQVKHLKLDRYVEFAGHYPPSRLGDWYRAADVTVLPSQSEGMPNVLRESRVCGTPFVASDVGGISEIATTEDDLVPAGDAAALAKALVKQITRHTAGTPSKLPTWVESADALTDIIRAASPKLAGRVT